MNNPGCLEKLFGKSLEGSLRRLMFPTASESARRMYFCLHS